MTDELLDRGIAILKSLENKKRASARVAKSDSAESDAILEEVTSEQSDDQGVPVKKKTVDELVGILKKNLPEIRDPGLKAAVGQTISQHQLRKQAQDQFGGDNGAAIRAATASAIASATAPASSRSDPRSTLQDVFAGTAPVQGIPWSEEADEQMRTQLKAEPDGSLEKERLGYELTLKRLAAFHRATGR
jgi:hypothetical protein